MTQCFTVSGSQFLIACDNFWGSGIPQLTALAKRECRGPKISFKVLSCNARRDLYSDKLIIVPVTPHIYRDMLPDSALVA